MKYFLSAFFTGLILTAASITAVAQETETKVVDEVVAQVNEGVITLSRVKREAKGVVDSYVQEGKKPEEAQKLVDEKQGELIASLINEELLMQRAKELGVETEIEASLNERFLQIMKQYDLKTLDALYAEMERTGVNPQDIREIWRKQATRDLVLQREVQSKLYWNPSGKEIKEYYDKNISKFTKPATVTVSEIFLSYAGKDENTVRERAKKLVAELRAGADFTKLALENSDRPDVAQTKGKVGTLIVKDLEPHFAKGLENVKVGGVTEPIEVAQIGIDILKVDERVNASNEAHFDENAVRLAMMNERVPDEQKKFMAKLREDSYIKISDTYRPLVSPILFAEERKAKADNSKPEN